MDDAALLSRLESDVAAIEAVATAGDGLDAPVPACPGWLAVDLLGHLSSVQTWVVQILRTGEVAQHPLPAAGRQQVSDLIDGLPAYREQMRAIDPERPCWGMGPKPRLAGYWTRRQAHEHAIHLLDLHQSGLVPEPVFPPDFAADGVAEVITHMRPRMLRAGRGRPIEHAVSVVCHDTGDSWLLGDGDPVGTLTAAASELYLGLWGRGDLLTSPTVRIEGDGDAVAKALASTLVP